MPWCGLRGGSFWESPCGYWGPPHCGRPTQGSHTHHPVQPLQRAAVEVEALRTWWQHGRWWHRCALQMDGVAVVLLFKVRDGTRFLGSSVWTASPGLVSYVSRRPPSTHHSGRASISKEEQMLGWRLERVWSLEGKAPGIRLKVLSRGAVWGAENR